GESADGSWKQVRLNNAISGWCSGKYLLALPGNPPPFEPTSDKGQFRVSADLLHLRKGPGVGYASIDLLRKGTIVESSGPTADLEWLQVRLADGQNGWCSSSYLYCLGGLENDPANKTTMGFHRCITNKITIYSGPLTSTAVLTSLVEEETVNVLEVIGDGEWKKVVTARGLIGWCDPKYLVSLGEVALLQENEEFPWMPVAFNDLGQRELPGPKDNPRIQEYMASTNLSEYSSLPDETDWCAAFVNWTIEQTGISTTGWATVYPWMTWGDEIKTPRRGCVVTFRWDGGGQHVAFYLGECGDHIRAIGGNQSDAVWIKSYPKRNVVNYRIPKGWVKA
ncbi:MAG: TIGR02594 family protein, partial [Anaerolineales bacterium]|nr:TIGR02594 family protein [Anaerolineales bacterium]